MFGARSNDENRFFIDGYELSGVETIDLSYQNAYQINKPLGTSQGITSINGPIQQKLSLSRYLIYDDPILDYTGATNFSGSVIYNGVYYGFNSGYLADYSVNCAVGAVPKVSANFEVMDEMRSGVSASGSVSHPDLYIPSQGSISLVCDHISTNRVVGFDYAIKANRKVFYSIGSSVPKDIAFLPPLEYTASVQIDVDDAFLKDAHDFLDSREDKTVSFTINGRNGNLIQTLTIPKASIASEQLNVAADGITRLTISYIGHS